MNTRIATAVTFLVAFLMPAVALAAAPAGEASSGPHDAFYAIAMGLGMGLAAFGGSMGQGRAAAAALEGIARNPNAADKVFTPMLLGLALIESLVIFALVTALLIYTKFGI